MIKGGHYCPPLIFTYQLNFFIILAIIIAFCSAVPLTALWQSLASPLNFTVFLNVSDYQLVMYYYMVLVSIYGVHNLIVNIINCKYAD